ncbi:hypothetical protein H3C61_00770 [Candidatus Gracilibacteria bacterium]|nr:hypothetical protein [Candidatus Gracilibacteria bacterium]
MEILTKEAILCFRSNGDLGQLKVGIGNFIYFNGSFPKGKRYLVEEDKITLNGVIVYNNNNFMEFMKKIGYIK